jgi:hypothetical protein
VNISSYPTEVQVILKALKKYGMIVADNGSAWYVSGAPDSRWDDEALSAISRVKGSDFEVVETTGTAELPKPPPAVKLVAPSVSAGAAARLRAGRTFSRWGRFKDSYGKKWSVTVNYGDGTGTKRLSVAKYKRFHLRHTYKRRGTYTAVVRVKISTGLIGRARVKVVVTRR